MSITREELVGAFTPASFRFQRERREETVEVMMLTGGSHLSARGRERGGYRFGSALGGLRAASGVGPDRFPGVQFYFFIFLCFFSFSVFLNLSNTFQI
jgi:hypothetical protein